MTTSTAATNVVRVRVEPGRFYSKYIWIDLPDGSTIQVFYNSETRLFVADIVNAAETGGIEFVRLTVPNVPKGVI